VNVFLLEVDGRLHLAQGQLAEATQSAEEGLAIAEQLPGLSFQLPVQEMLAELDLHKGYPGSAKARLLPLLDQAGLLELDANLLLPLLVWAHLDLGEIEAAEVLAEQTVQRLHDQHNYLILVDALRMQAAVAIRQERWDEAAAALDEALALARAMPYPYAEAKALSMYGDLMVATGQQVQAREQYEAALAILRPLGEVPYAERIEQALAEIPRH
jgi:tetratricopeptide (TPR) repeat protein